MDTKITLSFNADIISQAKKYAQTKGISLSRLTEYLYSKMTAEDELALYDLPINNWVLDLASGEAQYNHKPTSRKGKRADFYSKYENNDDDSQAAEPNTAYKTKKKKK